MKISKVLYKLSKEEGKHSTASEIVMKYQNSTEFSYFIDVKK